MTVINHNAFVFVLILFVIVSSALVILLLLRGPIARQLFWVRMSFQTGICSRMMLINIVVFFSFFAYIKYIGSPGVCYITQDDRGDIAYRQYNCTDSRFVDDKGTAYKLNPYEVLYINQTSHDMYLATKTIDGTRTFVTDDVKPLPANSTTSYDGFADYNFCSSPDRHHRDEEDKAERETFIILDKAEDMGSNHHIKVD